MKKYLQDAASYSMPNRVLGHPQLRPCGSVRPQTRLEICKLTALVIVVPCQLEECLEDSFASVFWDLGDSSVGVVGHAHLDEEVGP